MPQVESRAFIAGGKYPKVVRRNRALHKAILIHEDFDIKATYQLFDDLGKDNRTPYIQAYGLWKDKHDFNSLDIPIVVERAKRFQAIADKYPHLHFFYCPFLEHKKDAAFMYKVMDACRKVAPTLQLVNNPIKGGAYLDGFIDEIHHDDHNGKPPGAYFYTDDGRAGTPKDSRYKNGSVDAPLQKIRIKYNDAVVNGKWALQDNGKANTKDETPRKNRKAWVTNTLDDSIMYTCRDQEPGVYVKKGDIYGSHSEQFSDTGGGKENKPFYITSKVRYKKLQLVASNGKVLATETKSERYKHGDGWLYRFSKWGFQYGNEAHKMTGSYLCNIVADGKVIGKVDPGFREPGK